MKKCVVGYVAWGIMSPLLAGFLGIAQTALASESLSESLGEVTRRALGGFRKGGAREGEKRAQVVPQLSDAAKQAGIVINSASKADFMDVGLDHGIRCYVTAPQGFQGRLLLQAKNEAGVEMGQSRVSVLLAPGGGGNVFFQYPGSIDAELIASYVLDLVPSKVAIELDPNLERKTGLTAVRLEEPMEKHPDTLTAYVTTKRNFTGRLIAVAYAADGQELERCLLVVRMRSGDGENVHFRFTPKVRGAVRFTLASLEGAGIAIESGNSFKTHSLKATRLRDTGNDQGGMRLVAYVIAEKAFQGRIFAKALDTAGDEIGRGSRDITLQADDAREFILDFPDSMDAQEVAKLVLEARPALEDGAKKL